MQNPKSFMFSVELNDRDATLRNMVHYLGTLLEMNPSLGDYPILIPGRTPDTKEYYPARYIAVGSYVDANSSVYDEPCIFLDIMSESASDTDTEQTSEE